MITGAIKQVQWLISLMRLWPSQSSDAKQWRDRRDKYLTFLLNKLKKNIADGTDKPCITGNILKDPEAKLNECELPLLISPVIARHMI